MQYYLLGDTSQLPEPVQTSRKLPLASYVASSLQIFHLLLMCFSHLNCVRCICHESHPSWFIIHLTVGEECRFLLCTFYHSSATSSSLRPNILLITLFKHTHHMPFLKSYRFHSDHRYNCNFVYFIVHAFSLETGK